MSDRLVSLLKYFELQARVFQAGPLCRSALFDAEAGLGYLHLLEKGGLRVTSSRHERQTIEEPSLLFYLNPTQHQLTPLGEGVEMVCASFTFGAGAYNPVAKAFPHLLAIPLQQLPEMASALRLLFREAEEEHCGRQAILDRLMEVVLILLLRTLMDQGRLQLGLLAGLSDSRLVHALNAMHADPSHSWSLERLAALAGMSRARFVGHFRDVVGTTPGQYLNEWRLGLAQSLLRKGKPVQFVSDQVGYANAGALSRAFKRVTGESPKSWQRRALAEI